MPATLLIKEVIQLHGLTTKQLQGSVDSSLQSSQYADSYSLYIVHGTMARVHQIDVDFSILYNQNN